MFGWARLLFFTVFAGGTLYVLHAFIYRRLVADFTENRWIRRAAIALFASISVAALAGRFLSIWFTSITSRHATVALFMWSGLALYVAFALAAVEPVRRWWLKRQAARAAPAPSPEAPASPSPAPAQLSRRDAVTSLLSGGALAAGGGVAALGTYRAFDKPEVTEIPIRLPKLPRALDGFTFVHLSDIHVGSLIQEQFLRVLVEVARAQKPDAVAITGDLVDGSVSVLGKYVRELNGLEARHGTWFVTGNHDYYSGADAWCRALEGFGWNVLRNRRVSLGGAGASFDLLGIDDPFGFRGSDNDPGLQAATAGRDPERASVLLAHRPELPDRTAAAGIDLQLSGHTHGGQLFPVTTLASLAWRGRARGHSTVGNTQFYVSRGCGFVGPPLRVDSPPEVVKLVLVAG
jgi:predicted MPP superfamily phosphohydrolase